MQPNPNDTFASYISQKRSEHEMTMRTLANALGVSSPYLYDVEQGNRNPLKKEHIWYDPQKLDQFQC
jgi:transcriptional regulator with XRE-family HTH domain